MEAAACRESTPPLPAFGEVNDGYEPHPPVPQEDELSGSTDDTERRTRNRRMKQMRHHKSELCDSRLKTFFQDQASSASSQMQQQNNRTMPVPPKRPLIPHGYIPHHHQHSDYPTSAAIASAVSSPPLTTVQYRAARPLEFQGRRKDPQVEDRTICEHLREMLILDTSKEDTANQQLVSDLVDMFDACAKRNKNLAQKLYIRLHSTESTRILGKAVFKKLNSTETSDELRRQILTAYCESAESVFLESSKCEGDFCVPLAVMVFQLMYLFVDVAWQRSEKDFMTTNCKIPIQRCMNTVKGIVQNGNSFVEDHIPQLQTALTQLSHKIGRLTKEEGWKHSLLKHADGTTSVGESTPTSNATRTKFLEKKLPPPGKAQVPNPFHRPLPTPAVATDPSCTGRPSGKPKMIPFDCETAMMAQKQEAETAATTTTTATANVTAPATAAPSARTQRTHTNGHRIHTINDESDDDTTEAFDEPKRTNKRAISEVNSSDEEEVQVLGSKPQHQVGEEWTECIARRVAILLKEIQNGPNTFSFEQAKSVVVAKQRGFFVDKAIAEVPESRVCLICPFSKKRIKWPGKGLNCSHIQCFDLKAFLEYHLVENGKHKPCPVCNQPLGVRDLVPNAWFEKILRETSVKVEEVYVNSDGTWVRLMRPIETDRPPPAKRPKQEPEVIELLGDSDSDEFDP
eukprot:TRINITY_DN66350_c8_g2_i1.p1 TRINITY_DN66350_c8_g2~~TRINITY_DN66350_c8_g2_i1.p1  ORF type:complete len:685 (+),score=54.85 TRINITY_DN66350_c8_g2_i1:37-2091(+)